MLRTESQKTWKCLFLPGASATYLIHIHVHMEDKNVTVGKHCSAMAEQKNPSMLCVMHVGQWSMEEDGISERAFEGTAQKPVPWRFVTTLETDNS